MSSYIREGISPLEIQQLQCTAPELQCTAPGSLRPPQYLTNLLTSPMRSTHERIFLETSICVFRGKPPTRVKCSSSESLWLIPNQATTSLSSVAEGSLQLETFVCVFQGGKSPLENDYTSIHLYVTSQAHP